MENSPQLLPDITLVYQLIIFFACYFVMRSLVFTPYLQLLQLRKDKTIGLKEKATQAATRAEKLRLDYEAFMATERKKVATWSEDERRKVVEEEKGIVQSARNAVAADLDSLRKRLSTEVETARAQLLPLVNEYSATIATKLAGKKVDASKVGRDTDSLAPSSQPFPG